LQLECIGDIPAVYLLVQFLLGENEVMCSEKSSKEETRSQLAGKPGKTASKTYC